MNNKERALLKKDLCGRLPYNVKIEANVCPRALFPMDVVAENLPRPYLRPMSSMTEDERKDFEKASQKDIDIALNEVNRQYKSKIDKYAPLLSTHNKFDWLNEHHFDYRGLIPMGLALEAPEDMYDTRKISIE